MELHSALHNRSGDAQSCAGERATLYSSATHTTAERRPMHKLSCTILIADDDANIRGDLEDLLKDSGARLLMAETAEQTKRVVDEERPAIVLLDIKFPDCNDLTVLKYIKKAHPRIEVLIISSQTTDVAMIVDAIKSGANDYVPKPFIPEELFNRIEKAKRIAELVSEQEELVKRLLEESGVNRLVGNSPAMQQVRESIQKFQDWDGSVVILGESGTGKELVARALHIQSRRRAKPFIAINCAAVPEALMESIFFGHRRGSFTGAIETSVGKFESAGEGTIFLDEIGDMPLPQQASLLRVLEYRRFTPLGETKERECRARFVFATNRNLIECVRAGSFREDLFYRINVARVNLPPLRSRLEDLTELSTYYCAKIAGELGKPAFRVSDEVLGIFRNYDWPGNVRELRNILESSAIGLDRNVSEISAADLPADLQSTDLAVATPEVRHEREELIRALQRSGGNQTHAARILKVHRNTIRARMRQYGLDGLQKSEGEQSK